MLIPGGCCTVGSHLSFAGTSSWSVSSSTETQPIHGPTSGLTFAVLHVAFREPDQRLEGFSLGEGGLSRGQGEEGMEGSVLTGAHWPPQLLWALPFPNLLISG